ncbi:2-hydroxy-acid oxidase [Streptomyces cellostaticus]|uniref:2-hydroxy-acid oxidase n=1 Tax=Streptomyces cellostaticus TaxID=67285 RepID=A0A101NG12_9ACTN|nr:alpha-hydroxy acid oxidase [Streptomyces cellostaticus]KUM92608.1 2-hydroxy-acid oxidase [Streptomyces cellostaticus]GHI10515.1 alpha-hydroxy-acid oxidizing enzyme [Streptomyces cellostaticus]
MVTLDDYYTAARSLVEPAAWDYIDGGSGDETTLRENLAGYRRYRLRPRVLVDVSRCDMRTTLLGSPVALPIAVAPTGFHGLVTSEAESACARAAGEVGALMVVSTFATTRLEDVARAARGPLWMQLYVFRDRTVSEDLVKRAEAVGYRALVVTVDAPVRGRRVRDLRNAFALPPGLAPANFPDIPADGSSAELAAQLARHIDPAFSWDDLAWLRSLTRLPIVLKGVLTAEDAAHAAELGVAAIVVSNHGGRQLDGSVTALDALPEVVSAVAGRCEVLVDGGVRRGSDALVALALGARAVLVGRPVLWGMAVSAAEGARDVLSILGAELETAMALCGRTDLASVDASLLRPASHRPC